MGQATSKSRARKITQSLRIHVGWSFNRGLKRLLPVKVGSRMIQVNFPDFFPKDLEDLEGEGPDLPELRNSFYCI